MSFASGDLVSATDAYGWPVSGVAAGAGWGGYVVLQPSLRNEGGVWVQPASVMVKTSTCSVIERAETRARSQALRDQEHASRVATWRAEAELRERARDR